MFFDALKSKLRRISILASAALLASGLVAVEASTAPNIPAASAVAGVVCSSTMTEQNNLRITPSHGQVFYIDSGVTPKVDAAYAAYKIDNSLGSARTNVWVQLSDFVGGTVSLANSADKYQQITVPANGTYSAFFLLKATGATTSKQSHVVSIFDKRPDIQGATRLASCDFSFVKVAETIKASANKINTVTGTTSPATATLGGTYTIVVNGQTGGVGAGSTPDFAAIWASPSAYSSWPTRALRLESTELRICVGSNGNANNPIVLTNQLIYYPGASTPNCLKGSGDYWKGTYTFRIIGTGPSALAPSPVAIISSGSQYKHSDVNGITSNQTVDLSSVASSNISVRVSGSSSVVASTSSSVTIRYQVAISTTSTVPLSVDEVIDQHDSGTSLVTGSVKVGTNLASLSAAADPLVVAADVGKSPPPYHFIGPYTTVSGSTYYIQYDFVIPCGSTTATYGSKVYAYTGDVLIGADSTSISTSNVTTSQSAGCATPTVSNTSTSMNPSAATSPATSVQATTATINGFAYPVSQAGVQYRFAYATDPNLVNGVTYTTYTNVTGSSAVAVSSNLTSLTASTIYYFQLSVKDAAGTVYSGSILSFQTLAQPAAVSITTGAATGITGTSATLNGTINPNLNALSLVYFRYGTSSTLSSGTTDVAVVTDDGTGTQVNLTFSSTSSGNYSVNSDSIASPPVQRVTGLSLGTTYYYRLSATCTAVTTYCPSIGAVIDGNIRTFTAGAPTALTADATNVGETSATLNGTVNANGNTTAVTFCWSTNPAATNGILTSSNCTFATATPSSVTGSTDTSVSANITGLTGGTVYYFQTKAAVTSPAYTTFGSIFSFKTLQILTNSPLGGGTAGTLYTASFTGTGGSSSYTWATASTLPAGLTLSSTGLLSGTPTAGGSFTIVVRMTDPASGLYVEKTYTLDIVNPVNISAASVSFTTGVGASVPAFTGTATPAGGISGALACNAYTSSDTTFSTPLTITNSYAAGTYVLRCTGTLAAGYTAGTNTTGTLTINSPSSVTIASPSASYVTGVGATVPTLVATVTPVSGLTGSATCAVYATSDSSYSTPITLTSNTAAGTYVVRCTGTPATNYVITSNTNGVLTINNPVTIAAASASFTTGVGATVPTFSGTATPSAGISGSLTCQVYSTGDTSFTSPLTITSNSSAGSYVIRCTGTVAAGYQITSNTTATLTILSPTPVNVTANSASFVTGVGATVPTLTAVVSPSAGATATSCLAYTNSSFTTAISLTANTPAGTYPIRCTVTLASNYILGTTVDATLTVYSSVVITANSVTYVSGMGNALPTISGVANPSGGISGSLSCSVFASSDTSFSTPLTISNSTPAGTYVIRCTGTEANGFQITANNTGTLTVNAAVTITFHGNFVGSAANTTQTDYGLIALQSNPYVRTGYTFLGWATTANGSALYLDQDTFNFSADTDLYAVWSA
ncbi:MAG: beta strand repeat-containing protein, partial [Micrococcales bacterium]